MAEQLPLDLEDAELWLPSDVITAVGSDCHRRRLAAIDDLAQKLASFDFFDRRRSISTVEPFKNPTFYPEFEEQRRSVSALWPLNGGYKAPMRRRVAATEWTGACFSGSMPVHKLYPVMPVDCQVERLRMARARVLQRQSQHHGLNRFVPARSPGSTRESGGTGVFLPRVYKADSKKNSSFVDGNTQFQQPMRNPALGKLPAKFLPSSEIGLPPDWSY